MILSRGQNLWIAAYILPQWRLQNPSFADCWPLIACFFYHYSKVNGSDKIKRQYCHNWLDIDIWAIFLCTFGQDQRLQKSFQEKKRWNNRLLYLP